MNERDAGRHLAATEAPLFSADLALAALTASGYKNTAHALAELIDNSTQAGATSIDVICVEKSQLVTDRVRKRLSEMAVIDNGRGMDYHELRRALQFGNGNYLRDRSGIGRFGVGLPNASISQAGRVDVWSWQNGVENALYSSLDVAEVKETKRNALRNPVHAQIPSRWREILGLGTKTGTIVLWTDLRARSLTWRGAKATLLNTSQLVGRIHRRFLARNDLEVRLQAFAEDKSWKLTFQDQVRAIDPMYLSPVAGLPAPYNREAMFRSWGLPDILNIRANGSTHQVRVSYSVAKKSTVTNAGEGKNRGDTPYGKHALRNMGVSLMRSDRELMLDPNWCIGYDPRERWWGVEVEFPPTLDDVFGVTNNKQAATQFAELASMDWKQFAEPGEQLHETAERLIDDGDPRGNLLQLADSIKRNLADIRKVIQGDGRRQQKRRKRHPDVDPDNEFVNPPWRHRAPDEKGPESDEEFAAIKRDLIEKGYDGDSIDAIINDVRGSGHKVIFLQRSFTNAQELFAVEVKGGLTEVSFNRRHPAFDDIFSTVDAKERDISKWDKAELVARVTKAVSGTKLIFAAWARYEREAGVDQADRLERLRVDWGRIAADFLEPYAGPNE